MTAEKILACIGYIGDALIEEAEAAVSLRGAFSRKKVVAFSAVGVAATVGLAATLYLAKRKYAAA